MYAVIIARQKNVEREYWEWAERSRAHGWIGWSNQNRSIHVKRTRESVRDSVIYDYINSIEHNECSFSDVAEHKIKIITSLTSCICRKYWIRIHFHRVYVLMQCIVCEFECTFRCCCLSIPTKQINRWCPPFQIIQHQIDQWQVTQIINMIWFDHTHKQSYVRPCPTSNIINFYDSHCPANTCTKNHKNMLYTLKMTSYITISSIVYWI